MANYTDTFRKPAMTDETGIAIAEKLSGDTASEYKVNTSAEYRKAPMSDETAREILAKIDGGGTGGSSIEIFEGTKSDEAETYIFTLNDGKTWNDVFGVLEEGKLPYIKIGSILYRMLSDKSFFAEWLGDYEGQGEEYDISVKVPDNMYFSCINSNLVEDYTTSICSYYDQGYWQLSGQ